ncbi:2Fe-2S iron-sulfur cluster-binding protein [Breoghania sp.]|uniref:2Fe-2S iron-sulfur cluster-binding protein n=1 Tax=Breoghania sp. TaxID=2065378 RepID=UPI002AA92FB3|nr:2Fe-2S iron-sulfur cluster-binding protein [Breoghania sp.]
MVMALQIGGGAIVLLALLQALVGLAGQVGAAIRNRRMDERRVSAFKAQTDMLIERAQTERARSQLTWSGKRKFRLVSREVENACGDICSFYLEPHDGGALPPYLPGQFLTFELQIPDQPQPVVRCYSLSDTPTEEGHYRVTIKRLGQHPAKPDAPPGLSSCYFHDVLKPGDVLDVLAPNGGFHLNVQSDRPVVLIAGGVGVTPVLSMLKWLAATGSHREVWFFYAARCGEDIALRTEIDAIIADNSSFHGVTIFSAPTPECEKAKAFDRKGHLTVDLLKETLGTSNYEFYVCGPPPMMEAVTTALEEWGVPEEDIHFEAFGPASVKQVSHDEAAAGEGAARVTFSRSGKTLDWTPEAGTLLELADASGIRVNAGCRAGNCGTCATAVKEGKVRYLTKPASKPAEGTALLCISCPEGNLVLDA